MHTHPRIREYVMVGANLPPPPGSNRVKSITNMAVVKDCGNIVHLLFTLLLVAGSGVDDVMQN